MFEAEQRLMLAGEAEFVDTGHVDLRQVGHRIDETRVLVKLQQFRGFAREKPVVARVDVGVVVGVAVREPDQILSHCRRQRVLEEQAVVGGGDEGAVRRDQVAFEAHRLADALNVDDVAPGGDDELHAAVDQRLERRSSQVGDLVLAVQQSAVQIGDDCLVHF